MTEVVELPPADWRESWEAAGNRHAPWFLYVCDKDGKRLELIRDPQSVSLTLRHNASGTGSFTLPASHPHIDYCMADGARWWLRTMYGRNLATGILRGDQGQAHHNPNQLTASEQIGSATWTMVDDMAIFSDWLIFPPAGQAQERVSGPAETVARTLVTRAASRLGIPVSFPASQGRGMNVTLTARYQPLADVLLPALTTAGLSLRVIRDNAGTYAFSVREAITWPKTIYPNSGVVESWEWSRSHPTMTRAHVLGPREGAERIVRTVVSAELEAALGTVREASLDARDVSDVDAEATPARTLADVHAELDARGQLALDEAARTVGLRVSLANTPELAYGMPGGLELGDVLRVNLVPGRPTVSIPVTQAQLSWSADAGFTVQPIAGEFEDSSSATLLRRISELAMGYRRQKAST